MANEIIWTQNAREDFFEITNYLEQTWSSRISEQFIVQCYERIEMITDFPMIGVVSEKDPTVRRVFVSKHNALYYSVQENIIFLLGFFDVRANPDNNPF